MDTGQPVVKVGVGALVIRDGKVLLAQRIGSHGEGTWGSFGGHIEFGETPTEALMREAREELGVEIRVIRFLYCGNIPFKDKQYITLEFLAEIVSGEPTSRESDRVKEVKWCALDDLPENIFLPLKFSLKAYQDGEHYYDRVE